MFGIVKMPFKLLKLILRLAFLAFLLLVIYWLYMNFKTPDVVGVLGQDIRLERGQVLRLTDEDIRLRIVGFDDTGCPEGVVTFSECTNVFIRIGNNPFSSVCSQGGVESCQGYRYYVSGSDYKTYAILDFRKDR